MEVFGAKGIFERSEDQYGLRYVKFPDDGDSKSHHSVKNTFSHVEQIFQELSSESLLSCCLHGRTQNANESFNLSIWKRVLKSTYVSLQTIKLGVDDAVSHFNDGSKASVLVFEMLSMIPRTQYMIKGC